MIHFNKKNFRIYYQTIFLISFYLKFNDKKMTKKICFTSISRKDEII